MEDFKWTDELVKEYLSQFISPLQIIGDTPIMQTKIEAFKKSKEPKKEYEILTYQHIVLSNELDKNIIIDKTSKHFEYAHGCQNDFKIYSVRRLSDGEVFSVGDKMKEEDDVYVIDAFWKDYKGNDLWVSYNQRKKYGCSLDTAKKAKEVLFTTEDGVGIHEGDTYYTLEPDNNWYLYYSGAASYGSGKRTIAKYFSTKEAGEDWLILNKPCLSLYDVVVSHNLRQLRELVKSKL